MRRWLIPGLLSALVLAVAVAAFGPFVWQRYGPIPDPDAAIRRATLNGQPVMLAVPPRPSGRLVIWSHGRGGDENQPLVQRASIRLRDALLKDGFMIAGSAAHGSAWGNDASVNDLIDLQRWARTQEPVTDTVVVGQSMGSLAALRAAPLLYASTFIGIYPVCDLDSVSAEFPNEVHPTPDLSPVPLTTAWRGRRVLLLASPADTIVPKATNSDACARQARAAGAHVTEVATRGDHGDWSNFEPAPILTALR